MKEGNQVAGEQWLSFESQVWMWKNSDGSVEFNATNKNARYKYDPASETVTISFINDKLPLEFSSPWSMFEQMLEIFTKQGAKIAEKKGTYKGKTVHIRVVSLSQNNVNSELQLYIEPKSRLLIAAKVKGTEANGNVIMDGDAEFEYPEEGPADIYELGVPRSAKVVNNLPPADVLEVLSKYNSFKDSFSNRYTAIVTGSYSDSENYNFFNLRIIYRNENLIKTEYRGTKKQKEWTEYALKNGVEFDSIYNWWSKDENSYLTQFYFYDGKDDLYVYGLSDGNVKSYRSQGQNPGHISLSEIGWPDIYRWIPGNRKVKMIEDDYSEKKWSDLY